MKKYIVSFILISALLCTVHTDAGNECSMGKKCSMGKDIPSAHAAKPVKPVVNLAPQGKKNMLPDGGWFTWELSEKPMLGTVIIKVQVFAKNGKQQKPYKITGESGMSSMPAHDSGPVKFQLNKKGDYLLPVNVVMPGEWRVVVRVKKGGNEVYAGKIIFSV